MYRANARITGRGPFPLDMLRYDMCFPCTSQDAMTIRESMVEGGVRRNGHRVDCNVNVPSFPSAY